MSKDEKIKFVKSVCSQLQESLIRDIENGKVPEEWTGHEMRQLISDRCAYKPLKGRQKRDYANTVAVNNL